MAFGGELFPTEVGISQGASLSPILGNMALMGSRRISMSSFTPTGPRTMAAAIWTRFADDMIITARAGRRRAHPELWSSFWRPRGLKVTG